MAAFKNKANGTWYVQFRYTDWKGERQQKLKRGFATKKEAQTWEREFLMQKQADVNMTFESFAQLYEKDMKPKLKADKREHYPEENPAVFWKAETVGNHRQGCDGLAERDPGVDRRQRKALFPHLSQNRPQSVERPL